MPLSKLLSDSAKKRKHTVSWSRFNIQQQLFQRFNNLKTVSSTCAEVQIPRLWVPPICHYKQSGGSAGNTSVEIDIERNNLHLHYLSDHVGGYLINGSTGDGWMLNARQQETVLHGMLDFMHSDKQKYFKPILLGALAHDYNGKVLAIKKYTDILQTYYNRPVTSYESDDDEDSDDDLDEIDIMYKRSPFVGFALTPPSNTDNQKEIEECLAEILSAYKQYPFALYQLPQITNSEMSIETMCNLTSRFGNIIMFKDSSGTDNILKSQRSLDGVFMVRGAEGNQVQALLDMNYGVSRYHGLLLSTANNYPLHLSQLVGASMNGKYEQAVKLSEQITNVSAQTFEFVADYPFGNPFTNSAKMVDFFMAFGRVYENVMEHDSSQIPLTLNGIRYDQDDLLQIRDILVAHNMDPSVGYVNNVKQWWKKH